MNVETQMKLARKYAELWGALFTDLGSPEWETFVFWAGTYIESDIVHGINRAARKVRKLRDTDWPMSLDDAVRYASSVMKNEKCGFRDFSGNREPAIQRQRAKELALGNTESNSIREVHA